MLFYKITGSIADLSTFSVEVADILLMDKGTSGYTEYHFDEDVAGFIMDKAMEDSEWMGIKIGHIHSHNTMGVFFSGVDMSELHENSPNHNFYLSLIVNNYMEMTAKISFVAKRPPVLIPNVYKAMDENGEIYEIEIGEPKEFRCNDTLFIHDCNIILPVTEITVDEAFKQRTDFIIEKASKKPVSTVNYSGKVWDSVSQSFIEKPTTSGSTAVPKIQTEQSFNNGVKALGAGSEDSIRVPFDHDSVEEAIDLTEMCGEDEAFVCYFMRKGDKLDVDTLEVCLQEVAMEDQPAQALADHIVDNFGDYYNRYFRDLDKVTMDDYLTCVEISVEELERYEGKYEFVALTVKGLKEYGTLLEKKWRDMVLTKDLRD